VSFKENKVRRKISLKKMYVFIQTQAKIYFQGKEEEAK